MINPIGIIDWIELIGSWLIFFSIGVAFSKIRDNKSLTEEKGK